MNPHFWLWLLPSLLLPFTFLSCRKADPIWPEQGKLRVLVSFPPLYCFAKNVAGDDADVRCLLTTKGPHDYNPDHKDIQMARGADLVLINGLELDEFVIKLAGKNEDKIVKIAEAIPQKQRLAMKEGGLVHGDHVHPHGDHDPHVWLGPAQAKVMVERIAAELSARDLGNKKGYQERAQAYLQKLDQLQKDGAAAFKNKKNRRFITTHESLGYFAQAFDLEIVGSIQPQAGVEGNVKEITKLMELCKAKQVAVIAVEPQYSKGPAQYLRQLLGNLGVTVQLVEVDPLETVPTTDNNGNPDPDFYLQQMRRNIDDLAKALL